MANDKRLSEKPAVRDLFEYPAVDGQVLFILTADYSEMVRDFQCLSWLIKERADQSDLEMAVLQLHMKMRRLSEHLELDLPDNIVRTV